MADDRASPERLNEALTIFQEFGPQRAIPVTARWQDAFPEVDADAMAEWQALFRSVEDFAYQIAERSQRGDLDAREACGLIAQQFPWLDQHHVDRVYGQAMYFVMK